MSGGNRSGRTRRMGVAGLLTAAAVITVLAAPAVGSAGHRAFVCTGPHTCWIVNRPQPFGLEPECDNDLAAEASLKSNRGGTSAALEAGDIVGDGFTWRRNVPSHGIKPIVTSNMNIYLLIDLCHGE